LILLQNPEKKPAASAAGHAIKEYQCFHRCDFHEAASAAGHAIKEV